MFESKKMASRLLRDLHSEADRHEGDARMLRAAGNKIRELEERVKVLTAKLDEAHACISEVTPTPTLARRAS